MFVHFKQYPKKIIETRNFRIITLYVRLNKHFQDVKNNFGKHFNFVEPLLCPVIEILRSRACLQIFVNINCAKLTRTRADVFSRNLQEKEYRSLCSIIYLMIDMDNDPDLLKDCLLRSINFPIMFFETI